MELIPRVPYAVSRLSNLEVEKICCKLVNRHVNFRSSFNFFVAGELDFSTLEKWTSEQNLRHSSMGSSIFYFI